MASVLDDPALEELDLGGLPEEVRDSSRRLSRQLADVAKAMYGSLPERPDVERPAGLPEDPGFAADMSRFAVRDGLAGASPAEAKAHFDVAMARRLGQGVDLDPATLSPQDRSAVDRLQRVWRAASGVPAAAPEGSLGLRLAGFGAGRRTAPQTGDAPMSRERARGLLAGDLGVQADLKRFAELHGMKDPSEAKARGAFHAVMGWPMAPRSRIPVVRAVQEFAEASPDDAAMLGRLHAANDRRMADPGKGFWPGVNALAAATGAQAVDFKGLSGFGVGDLVARASADRGVHRVSAFLGSEAAEKARLEQGAPSSPSPRLFTDELEKWAGPLGGMTGVMRSNEVTRLRTALVLASASFLVKRVWDAGKALGEKVESLTAPRPAPAQRSGPSPVLQAAAATPFGLMRAPTAPTSAKAGSVWDAAPAARTAGPSSRAEPSAFWKGFEKSIAVAPTVPAAPAPETGFWAAPLVQSMLRTAKPATSTEISSGDGADMTTMSFSPGVARVRRAADLKPFVDQAKSGEATALSLPISLFAVGGAVPRELGKLPKETLLSLYLGTVKARGAAQDPAASDSLELGRRALARVLTVKGMAPEMLARDAKTLGSSASRALPSFLRDLPVRTAPAPAKSRTRGPDMAMER